MTDASPAISETTRASEGFPFRPGLFYGLAFGIAWTAWAPLVLHKLDLFRIPIPYVIALFVGQTLGAFAPLLSLAAMQRLCGDPTLVSRVFRGLRFARAPLLWYIIPALTPIALTVSITLCYRWLSGETIPLLRPEPVRQLGWALFLVIPFQFALGMIGSPLGEEPGWRGYVLDGFARRNRPLIGSALAGCFWWIWHLPLFVVLGVEWSAYNFVAMASHSLLIDSLFLLSRRNLMVAMLYHQGINTSFMFLVSKVETFGGSIALGLIAVVCRVAAHNHCRSSMVEENAP